MVIKKNMIVYFKWFLEQFQMQRCFYVCEAKFRISSKYKNKTNTQREMKNQ